MSPNCSSRSCLDLEIDQCLASGPNSTVYLACDRSTQRQLVVKAIPVCEKNGEARQELKVAHALQQQSHSRGHAHVISYETAFIRNGSLYLAMEFYSAGDLHRFVESQPDQRLRESDAIRVWRQVVLGVQFLHDHGIAHRDLSLENVLLDGHGVAKVCDFGLSINFSMDKEDHPLVSGRDGKAYYMAPEVATGGVSYNAIQAEVWSLGVMFFILLTGSPLVQNASQTDPGFRALQRVGVAGILRHWRMDQLVSVRVVQLLEILA